MDEPITAGKDLVVLTADRDTSATIQGLLSRPRALGIREVTADYFVDERRDPGCRTRGHELLRPFAKRYDHGLLVFDREGCGQEREASREELEESVRARVTQTGWGNRAEVIVLDPELEIWVWSDSPHVDSVLGWDTGLRETLCNEGFLEEGEMKPARPKEAVEWALRKAGKPRSSSLYRRLASQVSLNRCIDPAFAKFKATLQGWFPAVEAW